MRRDDRARVSRQGGGVPPQCLAQRSVISVARVGIEREGERELREDALSPVRGARHSLSERVEMRTRPLLLLAAERDDGAADTRVERGDVVRREREDGVEHRRRVAWRQRPLHELKEAEKRAEARRCPAQRLGLRGERVGKARCRARPPRCRFAAAQGVWRARVRRKGAVAVLRVRGRCATRAPRLDPGSTFGQRGIAGIEGKRAAQQGVRRVVVAQHELVELGGACQRLGRSRRRRSPARQLQQPFLQQSRVGLRLQHGDDVASQFLVARRESEGVAECAERLHGIAQSRSQELCPRHQQGHLRVVPARALQARDDSAIDEPPPPGTLVDPLLDPSGRSVPRIARQHLAGHIERAIPIGGGVTRSEELCRLRAERIGAQ